MTKEIRAIYSKYDPFIDTFKHKYFCTHTLNYRLLNISGRPPLGLGFEKGSDALYTF